MEYKKKSNFTNILIIIVILLLIFATVMVCVNAYNKSKDNDVAPPTTLTNQQKVEIALDVVKDANAKLLKAMEFSVNDAIAYETTVGDNLFSKYGEHVNNNKTTFRTITQDYYNANLIAFTAENQTLVGADLYIAHCDLYLQCLEKENFTFGVIYPREGFQEFDKMLIYSDEYITYIMYNDDNYTTVTRIGHKNGKATCIEEIRNSYYLRMDLSTDSNHRAFDNIERVYAHNLDSGDTAYYCIIYSELSGYAYLEGRELYSSFVTTDATYGVVATKCLERITANITLINSYQIYR